MNESDLQEASNKSGEPYVCPSLLPIESPHLKTQGGEIQAKTSEHLKLQRKR